MKEKIVFYVGLFVVLFYHGFSQQAPAIGTCKIKGRVIDSATKQPVSYATITAFLTGSTNVAGGNLTDDKGQFTIENLPGGEYLAKIEFLGYYPVTKKGITLSDKKPVINIGDILLAASSKSLKDVSITASRNFMENHIDKLLYNVDKDVTSQGGVATDILKKVPMVSVDIDGNIALLGDTNVRVFINGKPSTMFDNNLAEALKAIPASQIKSIEVITSPGAQYDAQGTGGIINIVLKDNKVKGVNGNCSLSGGSRYENGSANIHVKNGSLDVNASLSGNIQLNTRTLTSMHRAADSSGLILIQDGYGQVQRNGYRAQTGFDWAINKTDDINGSYSYNNFGNTNDGVVNQEQITAYPFPADTNSVRNSNNYYRFRGSDWNINYKKKFARDGQELNLSYQGSNASSILTYGQSQRYTNNDSLFAGAKGDNRQTDNEAYLAADYAHPFSKDVMLNVGIKGSFSRVKSNSDHSLLLLPSGNYYNDPSQMNSFNYDRDIYATYVSITVPLPRNYNLKLGVRDEYTKNSVPDDTTTIASYNFVTPSGIISRTLKNNQTIKFSYARRIQRPGFSQYNPFINAADPANLSQGNPNILPQKMHAIELSYYKFYDKGSSLLVTLFYRYSEADWQGYSAYYSALKVGDSVYRNTTVSTTVNAGTEQTGGLNISGTLHLSDKLEIRGNGNLFEKYILSSLPGSGIVSSVNYRVNMNVTYQFTKTLVAELYSGYNSGTLEAQGKYPSFASYSFAIRQQLFDKKGTLTFSTTDPFNKYTSQTTYLHASNYLSASSFSGYSSRNYPYQFFSLSFSYKFGKIEYKEKKQEEEEIQNHPQETQL